MTAEHSFQVLIAGGSVAALEGALALRELAGHRVSTTLLAPEPEFVYRPMRVREPFGSSLARHYDLAEIATDIGFELIPDAFKWLDSDARIVHTADGAELSYDALLLATGAVLTPRFRHAVTLDDRHLDEQLHGLIQDIEGGYVHKLAFVVPSPMAWPLPVYELALMTARRAWEMNVHMSTTLVTPEQAPLAIFGSEVSRAVEALLTEHGILTVTASHAETPRPGEILLHPGGRKLYVDRVVALPQMSGPATPGVPKDAADGFIPIDPHCQVRGVERVWAAGDATDFPIKHGGVAAQQADVAAAGIAALAGAPLKPPRFDPVIEGVLLGADRPLYLSAHLTGGHGSSSQVSRQAPWPSRGKIQARYLTPYLEKLDRAVDPDPPLETADPAALR